MGDSASRLYLKNILSGLSSGFTDVKNAISGVNTKVDSIGTKVDTLEPGIITEIGKTYTDMSGATFKQLSASTAGANFLSLSGAGELYLAFAHSYDGAHIRFIVDGSNEFTVFSYRNYDPGFLCKDAVLGYNVASSYDYYLTMFGSYLTEAEAVYYPYEKTTSETKYDEYVYIDAVPIKFSESLVIQLVEGVGTELNVAYKLT